MTNQVFSLSRRGLLAGLGGVTAITGLGLPAAAQTGSGVSLLARPGTLPGSGNAGPVIWTLETDKPGPLRFAKGDLAVTLSNELPAPMVLNWLGIDGAPTAEPLTGQPPLPPGGQISFTLPLRQPGTYLISGGLLSDAAAAPMAARALIVEDSPPVAVDRDEVLLIEEWRAKTGGVPIAPGTSPDGTTSFFSINAQTSLLNLTMKTNERVRLRFINGCARSLIGLRIENHDVRVLTIDGAPAEPFVARDGQLVLAPGSRTDVLLDATRAPGTVSNIVLHDGTSPQTIARLVMSNDAPARAAPLSPVNALPSNDRPARLNLQGALRADLSLDQNAQWIAPHKFDAATAPVFKVKRGRTAVLAIANPTAGPMVFRLHGHHVRLLDKLDDGWKPYWLDTLMLDKGQTQRIAFLAEYPGRWLMEATALNWSAPKLVRCYAVE